MGEFRVDCSPLNHWHCLKTRVNRSFWAFFCLEKAFPPPKLFQTCRAWQTSKWKPKFETHSSCPLIPNMEKKLALLPAKLHRQQQYQKKGELHLNPFRISVHIQQISSPRKKQVLLPPTTSCSILPDFLCRELFAVVGQSRPSLEYRNRKVGI